MLSLHRCKGRCLLALSLACWALSSPAQTRLTADEAVRLAASQPHVRAGLEAGVERARSDVLAARTWENPTLELEQEREDSDAGGPTRETSVLFSQPIELGGRRGLRRDAADPTVNTPIDEGDDDGDHKDDDHRKDRKDKDKDKDKDRQSVG